jgi:hypothetical protein
VSKSIFASPLLTANIRLSGLAGTPKNQRLAIGGVPPIQQILVNIAFHSSKFSTNHHWQVNNKPVLLCYFAIITPFIS